VRKGSASNVEKLGKEKRKNDKNAQTQIPVISVALQYRHEQVDLRFG
jgi:hypothetical protein